MTSNTYYTHRVGGKTFVTKLKRDKFLKTSKAKSAVSDYQESKTTKRTSINVGVKKEGGETTVVDLTSEQAKAIRGKSVSSVDVRDGRAVSTTSKIPMTFQEGMVNRQSFPVKESVSLITDPVTGRVSGVTDTATKQSVSAPDVTAEDVDRINRLRSAPQPIRQREETARERVVETNLETPSRPIANVVISSREETPQSFAKVEPSFQITSELRAWNPKPTTASEFLFLKSEKLSRTPEITSSTKGKTFGEAIPLVTWASPLRDVPSGALASFAGTVQLGEQIIKSPGPTGRAFIQGAKDFFKGNVQLTSVATTLRDRPGFSIGFVAGEVATGAAISSGTSTIVKGVRVGATLLDPKFVRVADKVIPDLPTTKGVRDIKLAEGTASTAESLQKQTTLAGKRVDAVSAQRSLFTRGVDEIIVDKPLPTPDSPPLERSFFADPRGRLRQSRLGIVDEDGATFSFTDFATRDIKFGREKPQALIFPETKVADFPSNLKGVQQKLLSGQPLSASESAALQKFQLTPSGEFKPIGFLSRESEILISPGDIIRKESRLGSTLLPGEKSFFPTRVDIFEASVKPGAGFDIIKPSSSQTILSSTQNIIRVPVSDVFLQTSRFVARDGFSPSVSVSYRDSSSVPVFSYPVVSSGVISASNTSFSVSSSGGASPSLFSESYRPTTPSSGSSPSSSFKSPRPSSPLSGASSPISPSFKPSSPSPIPSIFGGGSSARFTSSGSSVYKPYSPFGSGGSLLPPPTPSLKKRKTDQELFSGFVRREGKFFKTITGSKSDVISSVIKTVEGSAAASFKILSERTKKPISVRTSDSFRRSTKEEGVFIERRERRIKSAGELREITYKGIQSQSRKGLL